MAQRRRSVMVNEPLARLGRKGRNPVLTYRFITRPRHLIPPGDFVLGNPWFS